VRMRYLPWMACAAIALIGAPALAAAGDPPSTAAIVAYDGAAGQGFKDASQSSPADNTVEITSGGTVTFSFPTGNGTGFHNVSFNTDPKPASCVQTKFLSGQPQAAMPIPPLPSYVQSAGWEGNCTFNAPGTYSFVCGAHPDMTGTVVVTAPTPSATATPTADPTTTPVPVAAATVVPTPVPTTTPPAPAPKISSAVFKRSKRTITIAGTSQAAGNVKIDLAYKNGKATRKKTLSLAIKGGKFGGTIKLSAADARKAQKLTVTVSYNGVSPVKKSVTIKK
jgi:plastocyanin